jgi:hypothetical protein
VQETNETMLSNADNHTCRRTDGTRKDPHEMRPSISPISPISPISMPTGRRRALGAIAAAGLMLATSGCGAIAEKITEEGAERIIESETGENVEIDLNGEGGISVQSDDGESVFRVVTEIPAEWPNSVPRPDGLVIDSGSFIKAEGETLMTLLGSPNGSAIDFTDAYAVALDAAGFTETSRFDSKTEGGSAAQRTYESEAWTINISSYVDNSGNVVNLSLVSKT